jgi:hypothetical protein
VPTPDDELFKAYLKQFRPLAPTPLPAKAFGRRAFLWAAGIAAIAILAVTLALHFRAEQARITKTSRQAGTADPVASTQALTVRRANDLLAKTTSFKTLVDDMAFRSQAIPIPEGEQSAVAVLGKEKIKL